MNREGAGAIEAAAASNHANNNHRIDGEQNDHHGDDGGFEDSPFGNQGYCALEDTSSPDGSTTFIMRPLDADEDEEEDDGDDSSDDGGEEAGLEERMSVASIDYDMIAGTLLARMEQDYQCVVGDGGGGSAGMRGAAAATADIPAPASSSSSAIRQGGGANGRGEENKKEEEDNDDDFNARYDNPPPPEVPLSNVPSPVVEPLSPRKEEQIRKVMEGIRIPDEAIPLWASGLDWESPQIKTVLEDLRVSSTTSARSSSEGPALGAAAGGVVSANSDDEKIAIERG